MKKVSFLTVLIGMSIVTLITAIYFVIDFGDKTVNLEAEEHINQARDYFRQKFYSQAETEIKKALAISPENPRALFTMGNIYYIQKNYDNAIAWYKKALAINPEYTEPLHFMAITYIKKDELDKALSFVRRAVEIESSNDNFYVTLGAIYMEQGKYKEALQEFSKVRNENLTPWALKYLVEQRERLKELLYESSD